MPGTVILHSHSPVCAWTGEPERLPPSVQGKPRGANRSPSFSTRRNTSLVSKRSRWGSPLRGAALHLGGVTGVETVGAGIARTE